MLKVIGFDLDNTLYDHGQYVYGAYRDIACYVSRLHDVVYTEYFDWIFRRWIQKGSSYNRIFEESYRHFELSGFDNDISELLRIYHSSEPEISLYDGTWEILQEIKKTYRIVIITDGKERTQTYKIKSLGLENVVDHIYISDKYGKDYYKPSPKMFEAFLKNENFSAKEMLYIGDHPKLDGEPCKQTGITFVRIKKGEYKNIECNTPLIINDIKDLLSVIEGWKEKSDEKSSGGNRYKI